MAASVPFWATIVNGVVLIACGLWAYAGGDSSPMALIPAGLGIGFLALSPGVKTYNKAIAHVVVFLALVTIGVLVPPLLMMIDLGKGIGIFRVGMMMTTSLVALVLYIKSFVDARRSRSISS